MEIDRTLSDCLMNIDPEYYRSFLRGDGTMVVELQKALYGCVESSKLWYDLLTSTLIVDGYAQNPVDNCVFNKAPTDRRRVEKPVFPDEKC